MAVLTDAMITSVKQLEDQLGGRRFPKFIEACEDYFSHQVSALCTHVLLNPRIRFVFVSGPTASGKTTFTKRFAHALAAEGKRTHVISLDDYYRMRTTEYDENGLPDYEGLDALELDLLFEHLDALSRKEAVSIPTFDFTKRVRLYDDKKTICPERGDLILVEGLHGLASRVVGRMDHSMLIGIFIMPNAQLHSDRRLLDREDVRKLRRVCRDVTHRATTPLATLDYWPIIQREEHAFVPTYLAAADFYVNSSLPYEYCVLSSIALNMLRTNLDEADNGMAAGSIYRKNGEGFADLPAAVKEGKRLLMSIAKLPACGSLVPANSILQEFI